MQSAQHTQPRSPLFSRFPQFLSCDAEEVRRQVSQVFCDHDLRVVGRAQSLNTQLHFRPGRRVSYGRMLYGATVDIEPGKLNDFYLIQIPVAGSEIIECGNQSVRSTPQCGTIISPALEFRMRHERNAEKLFIRVEREALEQQCAQYYGEMPQGPVNFHPAIALGQASLASLRRLFEWQLLEASEGALFDQPLIAARFDEALMVTLLESLEHNQRKPQTRGPGILPGYVKRAEDYMVHHAHLPLTAGQIAQAVEVSVRSLYAGFQQYRQTSPMHTLREIRLASVHAELRSPNSGTTVTETALRWGFGHLGQFSSAYKRRYGELPSVTLRRARG